MKIKLCHKGQIMLLCQSVAWLQHVGVNLMTFKRVAAPLDECVLNYQAAWLIHYTHKVITFTFS